MTVSERTVLDGIRIRAADEYVLARLPGPRAALSSAVLGGGPAIVRGVLNLKVPADSSVAGPAWPDPVETLAAKGAFLGLEAPFIGMMTAADMDCLRVAELTSGTLAVTALATAGLSNARRAGDPADWPPDADRPLAWGTINTVVFANVPLAPPALVEAVAVATEAKAAVLQEIGAKSRVTGLPATGTGTDAVAVVSGHGAGTVRYCGKHTVCGELVASSVMRALRASLAHWKGES